MTFDKFISTYNREQENFERIVKNFPWTNRAAYVDWLVSGYEYVPNSTRILAMAGALMPKEHNKLANRFITHATEETGHEKLIVKDIKALGKDINQLHSNDEIRMFHYSLYYWLSPMSSPLGILGFVIALESFPAKHGHWIYPIVKKAYGDSCCNFVRVHTSEDPDHLNKALEIIKRLDSDEIAIVATSFEQYMRQYSKVLEVISFKHKNLKAS